MMIRKTSSFIPPFFKATVIQSVTSHDVIASSLPDSGMKKWKIFIFTPPAITCFTTLHCLLLPRRAPLK